MAVREIAGIFVAIIIVAGLTVAVASNSSTGSILSAGGNAFADSIRAAQGR